MEIYNSFRSDAAGGGVLAGQVQGPANNTVISRGAIMNRQLVGLAHLEGEVTDQDTVLTGFSKLSTAVEGFAESLDVLNGATSSATASTLVKRDANGNASFHTVSSVNTSAHALTTDSIFLTSGGGSGKILTSDANGNGSWENPAPVVGVSTATPSTLVGRDSGGSAAFNSLSLAGLSLSTGAGASKVLTSDASGNGSWQTLPAATGLSLSTGAGVSKVLTSDASGNGSWQTLPAATGVATATASTVMSRDASANTAVNKLTADTVGVSSGMTAGNTTVNGSGISVSGTDYTNTMTIQGSGILLPSHLSTMTPTVLKTYMETYLDTTFTGPRTTATIRFLIRRIGKIITMCQQTGEDAANATANGSFVSTAVIPGTFVPPLGLAVPMLIKNGSIQLGYAFIHGSEVGEATPGVITILPVSGGFTSGQAAGWTLGWSASWCAVI